MLPMLIKRCLAYGVEILPYQLTYVLNNYETKKIPDDVLSTLPKESLEKYVKALYLCGQYEARDWSLGHSILVDLGFTGVERREGHRVYKSLVWCSEKD